MSETNTNDHGEKYVDRQSEPTNRHSLPKLIPDAPRQIDSHANTRHNTPQHDTTHNTTHATTRHTFLDQETGEDRDALSPCKGAAHHRVYRQVRHHSNQLGQHVVNVGLLLHHRRRRKERGCLCFMSRPLAMARSWSHRVSQPDDTLSECGDPSSLPRASYSSYQTKAARISAARAPGRKNPRTERNTRFEKHPGLPHSSKLQSNTHTRMQTSQHRTIQSGNATYQGQPAPRRPMSSYFRE